MRAAFEKTGEDPNGNRGEIGDSKRSEHDVDGSEDLKSREMVEGSENGDSNKMISPGVSGRGVRADFTNGVGLSTIKDPNSNFGKRF